MSYNTFGENYIPEDEPSDDEKVDRLAWLSTLTVKDDDAYENKKFGKLNTEKFEKFFEPSCVNSFGQTSINTEYSDLSLARVKAALVADASKMDSGLTATELSDTIKKQSNDVMSLEIIAESLFPDSELIKNRPEDILRREPFRDHIECTEDKRYKIKLDAKEEDLLRYCREGALFLPDSDKIEEKRRDAERMERYQHYRKALDDESTTESITPLESATEEDTSGTESDEQDNSKETVMDVRRTVETDVKKEVEQRESKKVEKPKKPSKPIAAQRHPKSIIRENLYTDSEDECTSSEGSNSDDDPGSDVPDEKTTRQSVEKARDWDISPVSGGSASNIVLPIKPIEPHKQEEVRKQQADEPEPPIAPGRLRPPEPRKPMCPKVLAPVMISAPSYLTKPKRDHVPGKMHPIAALAKEKEAEAAREIKRQREEEAKRKQEEKKRQEDAAKTNEYWRKQQEEQEKDDERIAKEMQKQWGSESDQSAGSPRGFRKPVQRESNVRKQQQGQNPAMGKATSDRVKTPPPQFPRKKIQQPDRLFTETVKHDQQNFVSAPTQQRNRFDTSPAVAAPSNTFPSSSVRGPQDFMDQRQRNVPSGAPPSNWHMDEPRRQDDYGFQSQSRANPMFDHQRQGNGGNGFGQDRQRQDHHGAYRNFSDDPQVRRNIVTPPESYRSTGRYMPQEHSQARRNIASPAESFRTAGSHISRSPSNMSEYGPNQGARDGRQYAPPSGSVFNDSRPPSGFDQPRMPPSSSSGASYHQSYAPSNTSARPAPGRNRYDVDAPEASYNIQGRHAPYSQRAGDNRSAFHPPTPVNRQNDPLIEFIHTYMVLYAQPNTEIQWSRIWARCRAIDPSFCFNGSLDQYGPQYLRQLERNLPSYIQMCSIGSDTVFALIGEQYNGWTSLSNDPRTLFVNLVKTIFGAFTCPSIKWSLLQDGLQFPTPVELFGERWYLTFNQLAQQMGVQLSANKSIFDVFIGVPKKDSGR